MKITKQLLSLILMCIILFTACKSAKDLLEKKDYKGAYESAYSSLKKGKDMSENRSVMRSALAALQREFDISMKQFPAGNIQKKIEITDLGMDLVDRYDRASNYVDVKDEVINKLRNESDSIRNSVGGILIDQSKSELATLKSSGNKALARPIIAKLNKVENYMGLSNDLTKLKDEVYQYGTFIVLYTARYFGSNFNSYMLENTFRNLEYQSADRLDLFFYNRLPNNNMQPDCEVSIMLDRPDTRRYNDSRQQNFTQRVEDGFTITKDSKGNDVRTPKYVNVSATVNINSEVTEMSMRASTEVRGQSSQCRSLNSRYYTGTSRATREQYSYSGDSRAVPSRYRSTYGGDNKTEQQMEEEVLRQIVNDIRGGR
jgi:uncharacterized protein YlxP (DUF503 family)